jgi:ABC-type glycerol-3-phosphate transport system permease component
MEITRRGICWRLWNSLLVASVTTMVVLLINAMAASTFARIDFPGREALF